ncbi:chemotaxis protein CheA [Spirochaeta lutea]|nr:chemotaxis protein CheA [Spirochaeta lutea]
MSKTGMDKFKETFREEARELLFGLEQSLLSLEENPGNTEEIGAVFRAMHTIKGSAAMFGFEHISQFTHELETMFDQVRKGVIAVTSDLVTVMLDARDHIRELLELDGQPDPELDGVSEQIITKVRDLCGVASHDEEDETAVVAAPLQEGEGRHDHPGGREDSRESSSLTTYRVQFKPKPEIFQNGTRPLNLLAELRALGESTIVPYVHSLPSLQKVDPEVCYFSWDVIITTHAGIPEIQDIFLFVQDTADVEIRIIDHPQDNQDATDFRLGQILVERGVIDDTRLKEAIKLQKRIGEVLIEQGLSSRDVQAALEEQEHIRRTRQKLQQESAANSVRVSSEKLDSLVDLVGELVTLQARLSQTAGEGDNPGLKLIAEGLERLTAELRDSTMSIRMLPIGTTFTRFKRLVRDLSADLGKDIDFHTVGGETELDKTVIERLNEPLVHLIRNSIDHGIELPNIRSSTGKPAQGTLTLRAEHSGASVVITIEDDGRGLDAERIKKKAIEQGLLPSNADLPETELFQLIMEPGFSTAEQVTQVSGRGVGMDVVRQEIESLGGNLRIESRIGQYTRMILEIPLTLAIIEGLLVHTGGEHYVFPLSLVEECLEYSVQQRQSGKGIMRHRDEALPILDLRDVLEVPGDSPVLQQVVVVHSGDQKVGVIVDTVIGDHQTVVKNLGRLYRDAEGVSGATILGDGSVALILDVKRLVRLAGQIEAESR